MMQHARDQLLASAALALDQHRRVSRRGPAHDRGKTAARGTLGDERRRHTRHVELLMEQAILPPKRGNLDGLADHRRKVIGVDRLGEIIESAMTHRRDRR